MNYQNKLISTAVFCCAATNAFSFSPDLVKGCEIISEGRKNTKPEDAIDAAYCLGVIDGIFATVAKNQNKIPMPDPCFTERLVDTKEMAGNVVKVLAARPKILEAARKVGGRSESTAGLIALSIAYQCR